MKYRCVANWRTNLRLESEHSSVAVEAGDGCYAWYGSRMHSGREIDVLARSQRRDVLGTSLATAL